MVKAMDSLGKSIVNQALKLSAAERIVLAEQLLVSLDSPDAEIDALWADEAENRLEAYDKGQIESTKLEDVFAKYQK